MNQTNKIYKNVIVGAGIAGLTAAYKLHKQGEEFLLIEASDRVGGNWSSNKYKTSIYEFGPNTLMNRSEEINQMIQELGIEDEILTEKFKDSVRYLYLDDKFYEIGSNPLKVLLSGILSPWAIIRAALEPLVPSRRHPEETKSTKDPMQKQDWSTGSFANTQDDDESVYDFISRRFGKELAERIVSPALQGIWAGDTKNLSAKVALKTLVQYEEEYGSIIKAVILRKRSDRRIQCTSSTDPLDPSASPQDDKPALASISFKQGMQYLTLAIADSLPQDSIVLNMSLRGVRKHDVAIQSYILELDNGEKIETKNLILATKAYQAAELLQDSAPDLSKQLKRIYYAPIFLMAFTLPKKLFKKKELRGFGYISGKAEHLTLGTIFSSELFHERNLEDEYLLQSFIGGSKNTQILDFPEGDLMLQAIAEQKEIFKNAYGIDLKDSDFNIISSMFIKRAIPQYGLDFSEIKSSIDKELKDLAGLSLVGNYLNGVSIPDTVKLSLGDR